MEFFRTVDITTHQTDLQKKITFDTLPDIYPDMFVLEGKNDLFQIGSFWGEFWLRRDKIMGGIRFSMLDCPNAIAWTITTGYPPERNKIIIHLTLNRLEKPREFLLEIEELLDGWTNGLNKFFTEQTS